MLSETVLLSETINLLSSKWGAAANGNLLFDAP